MTEYFKIDGKRIKNPSTFKKERFIVSTLERLADATMAGEYIAQKRKYYFVYDAISAEDLDTILEAIWDSRKLFFSLEYLENGETKTATVYVGAIPADLHKASSGTNWVWKNVNFNLIER